MTDWLTQLTCDHVTQLTPYESARRLFSSASNSDTDTQHAPQWMNANESPLCDEYQVNSEHFNRYPDCQPSELIKRYAQYAGVESTQTIVTRGADEGIELLIRAFCQPGKDRILICPPTYGMYAISAETFDVSVERAPLLADFSLDIDAIKAQLGKVKVVFICSPNNPTGTAVERAQIVEVLDAFAQKAIVVVDEAYIEFNAQESTQDLLKQYPHLVILRTLSKAYALAGLRCGFALASSDIITTLLKVIAPYPIAAPVAQIASQALSTDGVASMQNKVKQLSAELLRLRHALACLGDLSIVGDTQANFVLFRSAHKDALMQYLVKHRVFIRDQSKQLGLAGCLRASVGSPEQNTLLLTLIEAFFADGNA